MGHRIPHTVIIMLSGWPVSKSENENYSQCMNPGITKS